MVSELFPKIQFGCAEMFPKIGLLDCLQLSDLSGGQVTCATPAMPLFRGSYLTAPPLERTVSQPQFPPSRLSYNGRQLRY
jgi:hypothetical protein